MYFIYPQQPRGARVEGPVGGPVQAPSYKPGRISMAKQTTTGQFEIPREMRSFAEQSVEQARKAFDGFMTAAHKAASSIEQQANAAQSGAKDMREKALTFAEQNVANSFEFAQRLVAAKDVEEVTRLQSEFVQRQMQALNEQAQELGQTATRAAMSATRPAS
jgi:phasin